MSYCRSGSGSWKMIGYYLSYCTQYTLWWTGGLPVWNERSVWTVVTLQHSKVQYHRVFCNKKRCRDTIRWKGLIHIGSISLEKFNLDHFIFGLALSGEFESWLAMLHRKLYRERGGERGRRGSREEGYYVLGVGEEEVGKRDIMF